MLDAQDKENADDRAGTYEYDLVTDSILKKYWRQLINTIFISALEYHVTADLNSIFNRNRVM